MLRCATATLAGVLLSLCLAAGAWAQTPSDPPVVQSGTPVFQAPSGAVQAPAAGGISSRLSASTSPTSSPLAQIPTAATAQLFDFTATSSPFNPPLPFATAQCHDGWFSFSQTRDGTCAGHGGVMLWIVEPPITSSQVLASRQQQFCGLLGNGYIPNPQCGVGTAPAARAASSSPTQCPQAAGAILSTCGSGSHTTNSFTVSDDWDLAWSFGQCSGGRGNFIVDVDNADGSFSGNQGVNQLSSGGSGTEHFHTGGTFYLAVNSECSWNIQVVNRA